MERAYVGRDREHKVHHVAVCFRSHCRYMAVGCRLLVMKDVVKTLCRILDGRAAAEEGLLLHQLSGWWWRIRFPRPPSADV